ncbi:hypothetical protein ACFV4F_29265 [Kitasatospora sp. NPDC059722]
MTVDHPGFIDPALPGTHPGGGAAKLSHTGSTTPGTARPAAHQSRTNSA